MLNIIHNQTRPHPMQSSLLFQNEEHGDPNKPFLLDESQHRKLSLRFFNWGTKGSVLGIKLCQCRGIPGQNHPWSLLRPSKDFLLESCFFRVVNFHCSCTVQIRQSPILFTRRTWRRKKEWECYELSLSPSTFTISFTSRFWPPVYNICMEQLISCASYSLQTGRFLNTFGYFLDDSETDLEVS